MLNPATEVPTYTLFTKQSNLHNYGRKMIQVSGPLVWNKLPYDLQDSISIATFKMYLKIYYIDKYADS